LWNSLASSLDGIVDKYFNRPVGRILSKLLVHTPVSPNQVSVAASLVGLVSAWLFAVGSHCAVVWGAVVLQLSAILDAVDGDLARVMFKESKIGKWLDIVGDQVVHIAVFVAVGVGLYRSGSQAPVLPLAASAGIGVAISLIVVVRGMKQLESQPNPRSQRLIESTANRDFSVLLIILAVLSKLEWFLWATAIGVHVFWAVVLAAQLTGPSGPSNPDKHREKNS
jgi:phosphatidylglycerophosphate synthase